MLSLKQWILAPALVFGLTGVADMNQAKADIYGFPGVGGISISVGGGYPGYRAAYGSYGSSYRHLYGHGPSGLYPSYGPSGHFHYHPGSVIRHRSHLHVTPGHYDYYPGRRHCGPYGRHH